MTWPTVALGEVADWGSGGTPKRSERSYFGDGVPWLSIADLNDGVVSTAKESLTPLGIQNSSAKVVPEGTIFVAMYGSIGKLGIAGGDMCTSQAIAFAKPNPARVDTRYLFHYLLFQRPQLQGRGRGGTQMNIGQADLKRWPVPLPPLEEQRRIAAILDRADGLCDLRRRSIFEWDGLRSAIFDDMFADSAGETARRRPTGDVATVQIGPFGSLLHRDDYVSGGVPVINPMHIRNGNIAADIEFSVMPEKADALAPYRLREGDVVLGRRGEMGRCATVGQEHDGWLCGTGSLIVRPGPDLTPGFLQAVLSHPSTKAALERRALGSTLPNLNAGIVKRLAIPMPPRREQEAFDARLAAVSVRRSVSLHHGRILDQLFVSLQNAAFAGEL